MSKLIFKGALEKSDHSIEFSIKIECDNEVLNLAKTNNEGM